MTVENPQSRAASSYVDAIEAQLAMTAIYANRARSSMDGQIVFRYKDLKDSIGLLYLLSVNVLRKYRNISNEKVIDQLLLDTNNLLSSRTPSNNREFNEMVFKCVDIYMRFDAMLIDLSVVKV
jgi:hypothetical protein